MDDSDDASREATSTAAIIAFMPAAALQTPIRTLLVANRGEIAVRVIRAAHELGLRALAVYGEGEQDALHARLADEAWRIPSEAAIPYLDIPAITEIARRGNADAIHPGYGFLSENAQFAEIVESHGIIWVGPKPEHIRTMGDKIEAKRTASMLGIPVVPGSRGATTRYPKRPASGSTTSSR